MLPESIKISKTAEDHLRQLKAKTKLDKNEVARLAIARSIEEKYDHINAELPSDGDRYPKSILLGDYAELYELLIADLHNKDHHQDDVTIELLNHLENGLGGLRTAKNLSDLLTRVVA